MDPNRFKQTTSGRLTQIGAGEAAFWAFIPNPLPPKLDIDLKLMRVLSDADRALGELAGLGRMLPNPRLLINPFIRREAVSSSRIEGTQADVMDLYVYEAGQLALPGLKPTAPESDVREVLNYVHALEYGLERLDTLPVSLRFIRELHERLVADVRGEHLTPGEFRRSQNWIGPSSSTISDAPYVPPPVEEMKQALYALETYLHEDADLPPLIRIALIHYQFEAIHPFLDGNGRIGRLLITLLLVHWDLLPLPLLYLSDYFERHRQDYYDLLLAVSQNNAWNDWIQFFLTGVIDQSRDASLRAKRLQDLDKEWHERLRIDRSTGTMYSVVDLLLERPILSAFDVANRFDVTRQTAINSLRRLEKLGLLREYTGQKRNLRFMAPEIMDILA